MDLNRTPMLAAQIYDSLCQHTSMSSEERRKGEFSNRALKTLETLNGVYLGIKKRIRTFSPYFVRAVETILAIGLLVFLVRWGYLLYIS